jgi:hypothetical protein
MGGTCLLAVALLITPSMQAIVLDAIGDVADASIKNLIRPLWPFGHGNCLNLDRFDPTCPHCL